MDLIRAIYWCGQITLRTHTIYIKDAKKNYIISSSEGHWVDQQAHTQTPKTIPLTGMEDHKSIQNTGSNSVYKPLKIKSILQRLKQVSGQGNMTASSLLPMFHQSREQTQLQS